MAAVSPNTIAVVLPPAGSSGLIARFWRMIGYGGRRCYSCRTSLVTHVIPAIGKHACMKCAEELARVQPSHHRTDTFTLVSSDGDAATFAKLELLRREAQAARREAQAARCQSRMLRAEVKASLTDMHTRVIADVVRAAAQRWPARHLWAVSTTAAEHAADSPQRAKDLACPASATSGDTQARGGDQAPSKRGSNQEVPAVIQSQIPLRETAIVKERDRIAAHLREDVIRRVVTAGLTLHSVAGLAGKPEVRGRIEAAIHEHRHDHQRDDWRELPEELPELTQDDLDALHSPVATHGWRVITICEGYIGDCSCGWRSAETDYLMLMLHQVKDHLDSVGQAHRKPGSPATTGDGATSPTCRQLTSPRPAPPDLLAEPFPIP